MRSKIALLLMTGSMMLAGTAYAEKAPSDMSAEERLARLERLVESQGLVDILMRLDNLQNDIQRLRGEGEVQGHTLEEIKKRQRDLYIDLDRRILQLERNAVPGQPAKQAELTDKPATGAKATSAAVTASAGQMDKPSEQQAYQKAFDLLRELRYEKASNAFRAFLKDYPNGRYAHIAQYWLGEAGYAQRKYKLAIEDYQQLIDNYPGSPKIAEAMLKIGYSQNELKNYAAAQKALENLIASYPGTTEAGQAKNLLQKIKLKRK